MATPESIPCNLSELHQISLPSVLDYLPDGIIALNKQGQVIYANPKFADYLGYTFEDLKDLSHSDLIALLLVDGKETYEQISRDFKQASAGKVSVVQRRFRHKNGYQILMEVSGQPTYDVQGNPFGVLIVFRYLSSELIAKVSSIINSSLRLQDIWENTTIAVVDYLGLSSTAIFLLDKRTQLLTLTWCNVIPAESDSSKVIIPMGQGAPGIIAQTKKPVYVANLREDPLIDEFSRSIHSDKSSIGYPLIHQDELLGVVTFDAHSVREFSSFEKELFEIISSQVALAVSNSRLVTELQELSVTDGLTGLYNHRFFRETLQKEFKKAELQQEQMSLIIIDIDFFKCYNDLYGHPCGDELLQEFALLLRQNLRGFDLICRYGGEEFAAILRNCSLEQAHQIAERIRQAVETHEFYGRERLPSGKLTVSIGIAGYPRISSSQDLLNYADQALYKAKMLSRNRVVSCEQ